MVFPSASGLGSKITAIVLIGVVASIYKEITPPPATLCGSPNGPPVTAPRIKLKDGRYLAYHEDGVPKHEAEYKIVSVHGFDSCRHLKLFLSEELMKELGIYLLSYDRAGYCESDPNPYLSVKSSALDVEELADQLELGEKFFVVGLSMGGYTAWGCLKYIPHRLAGVVMAAPVVNYWWPSFSPKLFQEAYSRQFVPDQWTLRVSHHAPWLTYWWMTQKWFPSSSVAAQDPRLLTPRDKELVQRFQQIERQYKDQRRQQGEYYSICSDMNVCFGKWEFDPMEIDDPLVPNGSVHIWQGAEDTLVPALLQRYVAERLPWIKYHEVEGAGHSIMLMDGFGDKVVKVLLLGEQAPKSIDLL